MAKEPTYRSLRFLGIFWIIKFCVLFCWTILGSDMNVTEGMVMAFRIEEYAESIFYILMMLMAAGEDITCGSGQLKWVIICTLLMSVLMEQMVVLGMGVVAAVMLVIVIGCILGPVWTVVLGMIASWMGVLGTIGLILFGIGTILSGIMVYGY